MSRRTISYFSLRLCTRGDPSTTRLPHSIHHRHATTAPHPLFSRLIAGERASLAKSITLVESSLQTHKAEAADLMRSVLKHNSDNPTFRIGISGPPGSGKSTFIEALGLHLVDSGEKVAVLAVDPSSTRSGGSLLADKTRMQELSIHPAAYIRPSPTRGELGGVVRTTNDAIQLCEAAGFNLIIVETVGVGQSEIAVSDMVDFFLLLIPPGGGDELQAIKKGVVEVADLVVVTKDDGNLKIPARLAKTEYSRALRLLRTPGAAWTPFVISVSSLTGTGIGEAWEEMKRFKTTMLESDQFWERRRRQRIAWFRAHVRSELLDLFGRHPKVRGMRAELEAKVGSGHVTPGLAADWLLEAFRKSS